VCLCDLANGKTTTEILRTSQFHFANRQVSTSRQFWR
jgi:hypothetical protein